MQRWIREGQRSYGGVYFIQCGEFVKIGLSLCIHGRIDQIESTNPYPVVGLGYLPMTVKESRRRERELHERFKAAAHQREWFRLTPEIDDYIGQYAQPWPEDRRNGRRAA